MSTDGSSADKTVPAASATTYLHEDLTREIIAAAYEVHNELGSGFLEKVYENALVLELAGRGISATSQASVPVSYKDRPVGVYYADILVGDAVVCEIKTAEAIGNAHQAQLLHYLKATGVRSASSSTLAPDASK